MAFLSPPQKYYPPTVFNRPHHPQHQRYTQCRNPCSIPTHRSRLPSQINLADGTKKTGNYSSWPGLTSANVSKYFPVPIKTLQGHIKQLRQGVRSTKATTPPEATAPAPPHPATKTKELYLRIEPIIKLYNNNVGRFLVRSRSSNYFIMLAYHVDSNFILVKTFQSRHDCRHLAAANLIMY